MVEKLSNLIGIFQKPELDFSQNRAEHDDILGDAYEYLMRHFASESGKSKGQFYTPSEVSRVIAKVIGIGPDNTKASTTAYDPTCGSGSLLLKVAAAAGKPITLEGQEKDVTTAGLARMNMILHDFPTASILSGNTLATPKFKDGEQEPRAGREIQVTPLQGTGLAEAGRGWPFCRLVDIWPLIALSQGLNHIGDRSIPNALKSCVRRHFQANDTCHDQHEAEHAGERRGFAQHGHADDGRTDGPDSDPHRVGGPDGQVPHRPT